MHSMMRQAQARPVTTLASSPAAKAAFRDSSIRSSSSSSSSNSNIRGGQGTAANSAPAGKQAGHMHISKPGAKALGAKIHAQSNTGRQPNQPTSTHRAPDNRDGLAALKANKTDRSCKAEPECEEADCMSSASATAVAQPASVPEQSDQSDTAVHGHVALAARQVNDNNRAACSANSSHQLPSASKPITSKTASSSASTSRAPPHNQGLCPSGSPQSSQMRVNHHRHSDADSRADPATANQNCAGFDIDQWLSSWSTEQASQSVVTDQAGPGTTISCEAPAAHSTPARAMANTTTETSETALIHQAAAPNAITLPAAASAADTATQSMQLSSNTSQVQPAAPSASAVTNVPMPSQAPTTGTASQPDTFTKPVTITKASKGQQPRQGSCAGKASVATPANTAAGPSQSALTSKDSTPDVSAAISNPRTRKFKQSARQADHQNMTTPAHTASATTGASNSSEMPLTGNLTSPTASSDRTAEKASKPNACASAVSTAKASAVGIQPASAAVNDGPSHSAAKGKASAASLGRKGTSDVPPAAAHAVFARGFLLPNTASHSRTKTNASKSAVGASRALRDVSRSVGPQQASARTKRDAACQAQLDSTVVSTSKPTMPATTTTAQQINCNPRSPSTLKSVKPPRPDPSHHKHPKTASANTAHVVSDQYMADPFHNRFDPSTADTDPCHSSADMFGVRETSASADPNSPNIHPACARGDLEQAIRNLEHTSPDSCFSAFSSYSSSNSWAVSNFASPMADLPDLL